jgi:MHS family shikimate/dehydroshikimate transporter-like MFS transporter
MGLLLGHAAMYAPQGAFFSELFGTSVRYSGASLGVQLSSAIAGGFSPLIATRLLQLGYGRGALSLYLIGMAAITIVSVVLATETMHRDIHRPEALKT